MPEEAEETEQTEETDRPGGALSTTRKHGIVWRREFWVPVAVGLAVVLLGPLVSPLPSLPAKVVHATYVFLAGKGEREDLKDAVQRRPFWVGTPRVFGSSLDHAVGSDAGEVAETDGMSLRYHSIDELAASAVEYDGFPTEFVGRVESKTVLSTDILAPVVEELHLTGPKQLAAAYVGVRGGNTPNFAYEAGQVVLVRGYVVASGTARQINGSSQNAVYVLGLKSETVGNESPPPVRSLADSIKQNR
jgi:hypothetical protein